MVLCPELPAMTSEGVRREMLMQGPIGSREETPRFPVLWEGRMGRAKSGSVTLRYC